MAIEKNHVRAASMLPRAISPLVTVRSCCRVLGIHLLSAHWLIALYILIVVYYTHSRRQLLYFVTGSGPSLALLPRDIHSKRSVKDRQASQHRSGVVVWPHHRSAEFRTAWQLGEGAAAGGGVARSVRRRTLAPGRRKRTARPRRCERKAVDRA